MTRRVGAWAPAILWAAVLYLLSSRSSLPIPGIPGIDKVGHFFAYLILGFLCARATSRLAVSPLFAVAAGWVYGALDEFHQSFVPGRDSSAGDWLADAVGVAVGVSLFLLFHRVNSRTSLGGPAPDQ
ncbi:MAG: VanZ family protein [Gemmatimonadota bacterium]|nr:VanZ family protein [Gemmatimonadota bacterium]